MARKRRDEAERFMSHVRKDDDGCWRWTAYCMPNGYGLFRTPTRHELAHRVAFRLFIGPLVDGLDVMHSCDNRACVNPDHISLGTRTDNMRDAKQKRRMAVGTSHGRSKLLESDVFGIKNAVGSQKKVADLFGISQGHVSAIRTGKRWAYLAQENYHR